ncbi:MAG: DUF21 domain-containing protein, partial [Phycisphaerales bacterium]|nr:DUF21 domain-containing protein [Phycisphaerales bacterium]
MFDTLPLILVLLVLIGASGLCSAAETAFFSLRHADRARLRRSSPHAETRINALLQHPRQLLLLILSLNMAVNVAYFATSTILGSRLEGPVAKIVLALGSLFSLILVGEVLAKLLASTHRVSYASFISGPLLIARQALNPILQTVDRFIVGPVSRLIRPVPEFDAVDSRELAALLRLSAGSGAIDPSEEDLLLDVVALGAGRVRDIMTPRIDMSVLDRRATPDVVLDVVRRTGLTKIPVRDDRTFPGMLDVKRYLLDFEDGRPDLDAHLEPIHFVPETARLDQLLDDFRRQGGHIALCVDEVGDVTGFIEIEDIV